MTHKRIAIIGAGASGLTSIKQLIDTFQRVGRSVDVVCYESKEDVGGVWLSDDVPKKYLRKDIHQNDQDSIIVYPPIGTDPSPMYHGLRTNLPYDLMAYRDHLFPPDTTTFPDRKTILNYLQSYASTFSLYQHIQFQTRVTRLYLSPKSTDSDNVRRWTIQTNNLKTFTTSIDTFDHVVLSNGHYAEGYIPSIPGLSSFPGKIIHSRYYLDPEEFRGKNVMVVGSFASGSDLSRQIASLNLPSSHLPNSSQINQQTYSSSSTDPSSSSNIPSTSPTDKRSAATLASSTSWMTQFDQPTSGNDITTGDEKYTKVYLSASSQTQYSNTPDQPWTPFIKFVPLIKSISPSTTNHTKGIINLQDDQQISDVDVIIFATGYYFSLPFCKTTDEPWISNGILKSYIDDGERENGWKDEIGGLKGLKMEGLDELLLFLKNDNSIAFPVLQYQIVPFPFAEIQARLFSFLWSDQLPDFSKHPELPPNPSNPYSQSSNSTLHSKSVPSSSLNTAHSAHFSTTSTDKGPHSVSGTNDVKSLDSNNDSAPISGPDNIKDPDFVGTSGLDGHAVASHEDKTAETDLEGSKLMTGLHPSRTNQPIEEKQDAQIRKVVTMRQKLVFGAPYEWTYSEFLMRLMDEAEDRLAKLEQGRKVGSHEDLEGMEKKERNGVERQEGEGNERGKGREEVEKKELDGWRKVEIWRRERREEIAQGLRKKLLGY
ncbi:hypothetical protein M231_00847 [Tremella mesenterica]|uniref:Uncharacterized protein n=1 Tax=Tremella mesenterica TaxID=5217 RepID=A0A4Q1BUX4_TREME|nr:hypothetical protein M231_00847 [Tremella mesenterica]